MTWSKTRSEKFARCICQWWEVDDAECSGSMRASKNESYRLLFDAE
jgi:hypothetical protein